MPSLAELTRAARGRQLSPSMTTGRGGADAAGMQHQLNPLGAFGGGFGGGAYGAWLAGTPMEAALPREINTFLQGAFGPLEPIMPQPIDAPTEEGRPPVRRLQYPVAWNLPVGIPGSEGIKVAPFQIMRNYAERYSVVRSCIRVRREEMLGLEHDITPTEEAEKQMRSDPEMRDDWMKRRKALIDFWRRPDRGFIGFAQWFGAVLEELFVTDALSIALDPPKKNGRGVLNSNLAQLRVIDGTTIRPLYDVVGDTPAPPNPAYQQYNWGVPRVDLMNVMTEEEAEEMSISVDEYSSSQLLYLPYWKRVWTPYGFGPVEQSLVPDAIGLSRQVYFLDYFTEGSIPGMYIVPGPEVTSSAQRRQLQDSLNAIAGDIGYKVKIVVLPHGSTKIETKEIKLADGSDTVITEMIMMVFAVHAEELSMVPGGRTSGLGGAGHMQAQQETRKRERLVPLATFFKDSLFDFVNQEILGQRDMGWTWTGLDEETDEQTKAAVAKIYIDDGVISRDEHRADLGMAPWSLPLTGSPTISTAQGVTPLDPGTPLTVEQGAAPPPGAAVAGPPRPGGAGAPPPPHPGMPPGAAPKPGEAAPAPGTPPRPGAPPEAEGKPPVGPDGKPAPAAPPAPPPPPDHRLRQGEVPMRTQAGGPHPQEGVHHPDFGRTDSRESEVNQALQEHAEHEQAHQDFRSSQLQTHQSIQHEQEKIDQEDRAKKVARVAAAARKLEELFK